MGEAMRAARETSNTLLTSSPAASSLTRPGEWGTDPSSRDFNLDVINLNDHSTFLV